MEKTEGPQFLRFFVPVVETLKELGGSGRPAEVTDIVVEKLGIPDAEVEETLKSGMSRVKNQVHWARFYLAKSGFIDASQRGVWSLTEKGMEAQLTAEDALRHFKDVQTQFRKAPVDEPVESVDQLDADEADETPFGIEDHRTELLSILKSLSPSGFERVCQRLLRESGFEKVVVTGRSGDGGIDGHGVIQINPFVSFKALFQSKRYDGVISPSQIRDFRGAMMGRADKGIFITTGTFSVSARQEALRDGVPAIELVDGEKLVDMFEYLELGLTPRTVYEIDQTFFDSYMQ
jgi:restriction system protein